MSQNANEKQNTTTNLIKTKCMSRSRENGSEKNNTPPIRNHVSCFENCAKGVNFAAVCASLVLVALLWFHLVIAVGFVYAKFDDSYFH